jgi:hypothetical protein
MGSHQAPLENGRVQALRVGGSVHWPPLAGESPLRGRKRLGDAFDLDVPRHPWITLNARSKHPTA